MRSTYSDRYRFGRILSGIKGAVVVDGVAQGSEPAILRVVVFFLGLLTGSGLTKASTRRICLDRKDLGGGNSASIIVG